MHGWPAAMSVDQMVIPLGADAAECIPYGKQASITAMSEAAAATSAPVPVAKQEGKPRRKRTSGSVRKEHLVRGAFLIEFQNPAEPRDMCQRDMPIGLGVGPLQSGKDRQAAIDKYRTMERKGFRVTDDIGCLIPDEQYGTYQQGATVKGHQRSFAFFAHWAPKQAPAAIRNEHGWPMNLQISHLCHRRSCCRVDHLVCEEQWRNIKRNFCGAGGECDCGSAIKCLRRYQMQDQTDQPSFCQSEDEVRAVLQGAPPFVIHGPGRHEGRDSKSKQRKVAKEQRKRKQQLHQHATERKQARMSGFYAKVKEAAEEASLPESDEELPADE
eukprot:GHUV01001020.1.p1 GENE.GHUV01001020.1~~GHUV01001020.1.p1  ORF type:complete len:327 (+),score=92.26 GHUV01001020.1:641-1621(+)